MAQGFVNRSSARALVHTPRLGRRKCAFFCQPRRDTVERQILPSAICFVRRQRQPGFKQAQPAPRVCSALHGKSLRGAALWQRRSLAARRSASLRVLRAATRLLYARRARPARARGHPCVCVGGGVYGAHCAGAHMALGEHLCSIGAHGARGVFRQAPPRTPPPVWSTGVPLHGVPLHPMRNTGVPPPPVPPPMTPPPRPPLLNVAPTESTCSAGGAGGAARRCQEPARGAAARQSTAVAAEPAAPV
ncbi:hypothetical protein PORY_001591 [Pneumocystis oryctolagi]|uniref:Uncharacterized protein n=1 Tax=Pneumocystis oryctolagi TaxID=42067 RepID=A0ACB7CBI9_9ASCO|nr:hypothetical protein PORY_001591 [Pneumocystis oryctolagi]